MHQNASSECKKSRMLRRKFTNLRTFSSTNETISQVYPKFQESPLSEHRGVISHQSGHPWSINSLPAYVPSQKKSAAGNCRCSQSRSRGCLTNYWRPPDCYCNFPGSVSEVTPVRSTFPRHVGQSADSICWEQTPNNETIKQKPDSFFSEIIIFNFPGKLGISVNS